MHTSIQTLTLSGQRFVVIPEDEYLRLTGLAGNHALRFTQGVPPARVESRVSRSPIGWQMPHVCAALIYKA